MRILTDNGWKNDYLDYYLPEKAICVSVYSFANIEKATDLYFKRSFNIKSIWEYIKEIGIRSVVLKIFSRLKEKNRNDKYFSIGIGRVIESRSEKFAVNAPTVFIAPVSPKACERVVIPDFLAAECSEKILSLHYNDKFILYYSNTNKEVISEPELAGFDNNSGIQPNLDNINSYLKKLLYFWKKTNLLPNRKLPANFNKQERNISLKPASFKDKKFNAALFGLGNYAKTQLIPNVSRYIAIKEIHEIDPTQLGNPEKYNCVVTTNPEFESVNGCNVIFAAGFHHTHAELAVKAAKNGMIAVIEKPLVTTFEQLQQILDTDEKFPGKIFSCYHMRYNDLFKQAKKDLSVSEGEAVNITSDVFEVPLPQKHWYKWPNSHSHIVSNGCHWIDHFLFMNDYSKPKKITLQRLGNSDSVSLVELENGACLCLHLTHLGSPRIGVQDKVIMRAKDKTVTVTNGSLYEFENEISLRRRLKRNRMNAYSNMYKQIAKAISEGRQGDSREMLEYTNKVVLTLDKIYLEQAQEPNK